LATLLNDTIVTLVQDLKARYRLGLPVMAPTEDERPLRTEEVVNRELDLGLYEHPVVLTLIASKDPFGATALAASSRLVAASYQRNLIAALATLAAELTRHELVRTGLGIARQHAYAPAIADRLGQIALGRVDDEREAASRALVTLLKQVADGRNVPPNLLYQMLQLGYASDVRRETLKSMLTAIFASPVLRPHILPTMTEALPFFPRELLIGVASEINHLTGDPDHPFMRREMQVALAKKETDRRIQPRPVAPRKPEIRPWMPMIQKASKRGS
jgi:hypothetical protein